MKSPGRSCGGGLLAALALLPQIMAPVAKADVPAAIAMTAEDVRGFLDGFMSVELQRDDIAGAVVCIVKDGKVLYENGYGLANKATHQPVSAQQTLFRAGSVSKLFTGTAIMQLVEAGKLDLDRDINTYLDFRIPNTYPQPITLRNLLTHTAGFGEVARDLFSDSLIPLGQYLKTHLPARIYAPGEIGAYSNYGMALAGYIVQRVSGEPYPQYIDAHIFKPLGMLHATFAQPVPALLAPRMSAGYQLASGAAQPFEYISASPAGALSVSGDDMAHFMIAHLEEGRDADARVLDAATVRQMHSRQYAADARLNGTAINFFEESRNGHAIIGHGGDTIYFHSQLHLILDANVGFFIAANSSGRGGFDYRSAIWNAFVDRYFPYQIPPTPAVPTASTDSRPLAGSYVFTRRNDSNFLKIGYLLAAVSVTANPDGTLNYPDARLFGSGPANRSAVWQEIGPMLYQKVGEQERIAFKRIAGRLFLIGDPAPQYFERVGWYQSRGFVVSLLALMFVVFPVTLAWWPIGALLRRHYERKLTLTPAQRRLRWLVRLICAWDVAVLVAWLMLYGAIASGLSFPSPGKLWAIELASLCGALATAVAGYQVWQNWRRQGTLPARLADTGILMACVAFSWFVYLGHLANFNLSY